MSVSQRIVQLAKWLIAASLRVVGFTSWLRRRRAGRGEIPVLWMHRVDGAPSARLPMAVPPPAFASLVENLGRHYLVDGWDACVRAARAPDGRARVALTFDDGYADNARNAWPVLRAAEATGMFFLTTSFVNGDRGLWWEEIAATHTTSHDFPVAPNGEATYGAAEAVIHALKSVPDAKRREAVERARAALTDPIDASRVPRALTWSEAQAMAAEGAVLGGHTVSHPILPRCTEDELESELHCRRVISERARIDVSIFAYPNGSFDDRVVAAVAGAGYRYAFTTEKGYYTAGTHPLRVPRIGVSEPKYSLDGKGFSWTLFEAEMLGVFDVLLARGRRRDRG